MQLNWLIRCLNGWFRPPHGFERGYVVCIQITLIAGPAHFNPLRTLHSLGGAAGSASEQTSSNQLTPPPSPQRDTPDPLLQRRRSTGCARRDLGSACIGGGGGGWRSVSTRPSCGVGRRRSGQRATGSDCNARSQCNSARPETADACLPLAPAHLSRGCRLIQVARPPALDQCAAEVAGVRRAVRRARHAPSPSLLLGFIIIR